MLCEKCGKENATTYYKQVINGQVREMHVCGGCANEIGIGQMFGGFDFESMFPAFSIFGTPVKQSRAASQKRCGNCGMPLERFFKTAKAGCGGCYTAFRDEIMPSIRRMHGKEKHVGKRPGGGTCIPAEDSQKSELDALRKTLQQCIERQDFEEAAKIRDQIKALEEEKGGGKDEK